MAITVMDTVLSRSLLSLLVSSAIASTAFAGELKFEPKLVLEETYTDNVNLTLNNEESSYVSQIGVELEGEYQAQYANFSLSAKSLYATYTHDHELDNDYHKLDSRFNMMLWPNGITLFAEAALDNRSRNGSRNTLADIVSADTVQVENYQGGFAYNVTNSDFNINSSISYTTTITEDNIGERKGYQALLNSTNGNSARHIFWEINGSFQDLKNNNENDAKYYQGEVKFGWISSFGLNPFIRYFDEDNQGSINQGQSLESNSYGVGLRWLVTPRFYLDVSYNDPVDDKTDIENKALDNYYDVMINWQPSIRTKINAGISQRFYGDSYNVAIEHGSRRLTNKVSYVEEVKTFTRNNLEPYLVGTYWCPIVDDRSLTDCFIQNDQTIDLDLDLYELVNITDFNILEEEEFSLNKTLNIQSSLNLARTNIVLSLAATERIKLSTNIKDKSNDASISIKRKVSGNSNIDISAQFYENHYFIDAEGDRKDRYRKYGIEYNKSLNSTLETKLGIGIVNKTSNIELFTFKEKRIYIQVVKGF